MQAEFPGNEIFDGLKAISGWVSNWGVPLAAIGTVSMALLQTAKNTLPLRSMFQKRHLRRWLMGRDADAFGFAEADLIVLATAGDQDAFYNSAIEDLCTEIKGVIPTILDYPHLHGPLLMCLAKQVDPDDLELLLMPPEADTFLKRFDESSEEEKEHIREYAAAKTRIGDQVRCSLDAIQASIGFRWKRWLQIASIILSAALGVVALYTGAVAGHGPDKLPSLGAAIVIGLLSGFLAPVARDLVAAVEKWRD